MKTAFLLVTIQMIEGGKTLTPIAIEATEAKCRAQGEALVGVIKSALLDRDALLGSIWFYCQEVSGDWVFP